MADSNALREVQDICVHCTFDELNAIRNWMSAEIKKRRLNEKNRTNSIQGGDKTNTTLIAHNGIPYEITDDIPKIGDLMMLDNGWIGMAASLPHLEVLVNQGAKVIVPKKVK